MSGDRYVQARKEAVECVNSLNKAMQDAGGSIPDAKRLEEMSLMEFITTVAAQNHIRFCYERPPYKGEPIIRPGELTEKSVAEVHTTRVPPSNLGPGQIGDKS